jgi:hypothetical protein
MKLSHREYRLARRLARKAHLRQGGLCWWCGQPMVLQNVNIGDDGGTLDPRQSISIH